MVIVCLPAIPYHRRLLQDSPLGRRYRMDPRGGGRAWGVSMAIHQGRVVWITGRPATGKTTLARQLIATLQQRNVPHLWLDSDDLRSVLTPGATYHELDRDRFYATVGHLARRAAAGGVLVVISATGSKRAYRDAVRAVVASFFEVWLDCPRELLLERDPKGLYRMSEAGQLDQLPGEGTPFEAPLRAELVIDSGVASPSQMHDQLLAVLDSA